MALLEDKAEKGTSTRKPEKEGHKPATHRELRAFDVTVPKFSRSEPLGSSKTTASMYHHICTECVLSLSIILGRRSLCARVHTECVTGGNRYKGTLYVP